MAKKRRITEEKVEEEYEFIPPEFDEKEFILRDFYATKILLVIAAFAVVIGILCSLVQRTFTGDLGMWLGLLLLFLGMFFVKPLLKITKFDATLIENKSLIGDYICYLLLGLGVWILCINPPFW